MKTGTMEPIKIPRVKICCINSIKEARMAIKYGASAVGLVSDMPSGPGVIPEPRIAKIARIIPPTVSSFLLTKNQHTESIVTQQRRTGVNTIQICDTFLGDYTELKHTLPGIKIVQVIHVIGESSIEEACSVAPYVDALLLDSGNQYLPVKELGGTGRIHNWRMSRKIRESVNIPVFLAGGLTPENVAEAVDQVAPFGVDVCTGVRTHGKLDKDKLIQFFNALAV
jgi:phosphoribosylanthranilate isomerase